MPAAVFIQPQATKKKNRGRLSAKSGLSFLGTNTIDVEIATVEPGGPPLHYFFGTGRAEKTPLIQTVERSKSAPVFGGVC